MMMVIPPLNVDLVVTIGHPGDLKGYPMISLYKILNDGW